MSKVKYTGDDWTLENSLIKEFMLAAVVNGQLKSADSVLKFAKSMANAYLDDCDKRFEELETRRFRGEYGN